MIEYPLEEELETVQKLANFEFIYKKEGVELFLNYFKGKWKYSNMGGLKLNNGILELHTYGWSGNEDLVDSLHGTLFWAFYWWRSERGGHYWFDLKRVYEIEDEI